MFDSEACIRCRQRFKFEELGVAPGGFSICRECEKKLGLKDAPERRCLADGAKMTKALLQGRVVFDRCPACGGLWLDGDEVEVLKGLAGERDAANMMLFVIAAL